jgi:UDP:flavonoid glycosyltransferase YjiC (YdhE family)
LAPSGSFGDLNPFLGIGRELSKRGYHAIIASSAEWQDHVENAGLGFRLTRPGWNTTMDPNRLTEYIVASSLFPDFRASFDDLLSAVRDAEARVTLTMTVAAPLVAGKTGLPWVSGVLEPMSFFSACEPLLLPSGLPFSELKRLSKLWTEPVYRLRAELGLPLGRDPVFEEYLAADAVLALFSPLLGNRQPDWPPVPPSRGSSPTISFPLESQPPTHCGNFSMLATACRVYSELECGERTHGQFLRRECDGRTNAWV